MKLPSKIEAINAVKVLLKFIGENPDREGLVNTPNRVIARYQEMLSGYTEDIAQILQTKFKDEKRYSNFILLKNIEFQSMCEHHMLPVIGFVDVAYIPNGFIVGISKIARAVDVFAKRLQLQERMTCQIADALDLHLQPLGVAVRVSAIHSCMTIRGVKKINSSMDTMHYTGQFTTNPCYREEFIQLIK